MPQPVRRGLIAAVFALLLPAAAGADTKAVYESPNGKSAMTYMIKGPMVRFEAPGLARDRRYGLFDSARGVMILVDDARKELIEIKPEQIRQQRQQMQAQMAPMMKQLQEQLKNMPPEQRRVIEKQMGAMMQPPGGAAKTTYTTKPIGNGSVLGISCQRLAVLRDGEPQQEICLATRADAKVPAGDYATMRKMIETMRTMASDVAAISMPMTDDLEGVPLEMKNLADGQIHSLKSLSTSTLPGDAFALPPYKKKDFGAMPGMR